MDTPKTPPKMLVIYYSQSFGNTAKVAQFLAASCGADIARIETAVPYEGTHKEIVDLGLQQVQQKYRPVIKPLGVSIEDYDVIAVGTPTWWYTMAPAVLTFLRQSNFKGKTVIPFATNAGYAGHTIKDIQRECPGADFAAEITVKFSADDAERDRMLTSMTAIDNWVQRVKGVLHRLQAQATADA